MRRAAGSSSDFGVRQYDASSRARAASISVWIAQAQAA